jgi:hypothetical protein
MSIFSPLLQSLDQRSWTWGDVASGHLSGRKAFVALSKSKYRVDFYQCVGSAANSYKLYNQAHTAGLFQRYPGLIRPIKYGAIALLTMNFLLAHLKAFNAVTYGILL